MPYSQNFVNHSTCCQITPVWATSPTWRGRTAWASSGPWPAPTSASTPGEPTCDMLTCDMLTCVPWCHYHGDLTWDLCVQSDRDCERQRGGPDIQRQQQRGGAYWGEDVRSISDMMTAWQCHVVSLLYCHTYAVQLSMCCDQASYAYNEGTIWLKLWYPPRI